MNESKKEGKLMLLLACLDGVGEGERDDVSRADPGVGGEARGRGVDERVEVGVGELDLARDGDGAAGREGGGRLLEQRREGTGGGSVRRHWIGEDKRSSLGERHESRSAAEQRCGVVRRASLLCCLLGLGPFIADPWAWPPVLYTAAA